MSHYLLERVRAKHLEGETAFAYLKPRVRTSRVNLCVEHSEEKKSRDSWCARYPEFKTNKFRKTVLSMFDGCEDTVDHDGCLRDLRLVPDAHAYYSESKVLVCIEIENYHKVDVEKLASYFYLEDCCLHDCGVDLLVFGTNRDSLVEKAYRPMTSFYNRLSVTPEPLYFQTTHREWEMNRERRFSVVEADPSLTSPTSV